MRKSARSKVVVSAATATGVRHAANQLPKALDNLGQPAKALSEGDLRRAAPISPSARRWREQIRLYEWAIRQRCERPRSRPQGSGRKLWSRDEGDRLTCRAPAIRDATSRVEFAPVRYNLAVRAWRGALDRGRQVAGGGEQ
jgi:hypothetical protein